MNNQSTAYKLDQLARVLENRIEELEQEIRSSNQAMKNLLINTLRLNKHLLEDVQLQSKEILSMPRT